MLGLFGQSVVDHSQEAVRLRDRDAGGAQLAGRDKMFGALQRLSRTYGENTLPRQVQAFGISGAVGAGNWQGDSTARGRWR